jgi:dCMP deaminase
VLYCTHYPCALCAKMLVNAGVKSLVLSENYPDALAKELFTEAGIEIVFIV